MVDDNVTVTMIITFLLAFFIVCEKQRTKIVKTLIKLGLQYGYTACFHTKKYPIDGIIGYIFTF